MRYTIMDANTGSNNNSFCLKELCNASRWYMNWIKRGVRVSHVKRGVSHLKQKSGGYIQRTRNWSMVKVGRDWIILVDLNSFTGILKVYSLPYRWCRKWQILKHRNDMIMSWLILIPFCKSKWKRKTGVRSRRIHDIWQVSRFRFYSWWTKRKVLSKTKNWEVKISKARAIPIV